MTVFNGSATNHLEAKMFFDPGGTVGIARYDQVKYPEIEHLTKKQISFYWNPEEVDIIKDASDFKNVLTPHGQHIFTSNLKRQIILDSVQGRSPTAVFGSVTALPEMENWAQTWAFFETIHSRSYTHIIQQIYSDPSIVFDNMMNIPEIVDCAKDISAYYDDFIEYSMWFQLLGYGTHYVNGRTIVIDEYILKKKLWLTVAAINILEGIRFYVSFACSWAFAENKLMEGNAKIIRMICRDENLHLASTQKLMRTILPQDDPIYARIKRDTKDQVIAMYHSAMNQEKTWAKFLFQGGSIIGLNEPLLCNFIDFRGSHMMRAVGYTPDFEAPRRNPLPWTDSWISSKTVKVAPQETESSQYVIGGHDSTISEGAFKGFKL